MMFKPVSKTAFYSAGVRVLDAESSRPILRDALAKRVMGKGGLARGANTQQPANRLQAGSCLGPSPVSWNSGGGEAPAVANSARFKFSEKPPASVRFPYTFGKHRVNGRECERKFHRR